MEDAEFDQTTEANRLSDNDFRRLSAFIYEQCGIKIPPSKRTVLTARMQKRLHLVGMRTFAEYIDWLLDPYRSEGELLSFIDILRTNKTVFFRDSSHFEYLAQIALPDLIKNLGAGVRRELMIWSVGCSSGEEPYTLAIVLKEFGRHYPGISLKANILATDVSAQVLETATNAIYDLERADGMPVELKQKYLLKSKDRLRRQIRVCPEVRSMVKFRELDFIAADFGLREKMDVIFCRDVIVYFNRFTQETLINKLCRYLNPGGFLFMGQSETLNDMDVPVNQVANAVYQKPF